MNSIHEIDLFFRKISPDKGFVYLTDATNQPTLGLILQITSQIEPLISKYSIADLKSQEKRIDLGQQIYQIFEGTPLFKHLSHIAGKNQSQQIFTRFVWHYHQNEKLFSNLYLELLHNGENFLFNAPFILSNRQPRSDSFTPCKELNSPLRILLLNQAANHQNSNEVIRALLPQMSQRLLEIEVFEKPIDADAAHYIATFEPHVIWYISHPDLEKSREFDSFNLARLIKVIPAISVLRLLVIEGLEALTDENEFSLTRWEPEFSNLQISARIILPDVVSPEFKSEFFQQIIAQEPVDLALKYAQNALTAEQQTDTTPPIIYAKSLNAISKIQASSQIISPLHGNEATMTWSYLYSPVLTSMRNHELSRMTRALFEKNKSVVAICGEAGIGKSELCDQFIIQQSYRFSIILRFQRNDYQLPHLLVAKLAESLNLSGKCSANLEHLNLNNIPEKSGWLTEALNHTPVLLVFEDVAPDILTAQQSEPFSGLIHSLVNGIQQNTKIIFSSRNAIDASNPFENQIEILPLTPFQFERNWELILHSENAEMPRFMMTRPEDETVRDALPWQDLTKIHTKLAAEPTLIKLLRYAGNSIPPAELQHILLHNSCAEIREMLFRKFQQMLSNDVTDLMITCLFLPKNFKIEQLFFIYKHLSSNYEVIAEYLVELVNCGLVTQQCHCLREEEILTCYQINPFFTDYLNQHFAEKVCEKRTPTLEKLCAYFENNAEQQNDLESWLKAIDCFYQADQLTKAQKHAGDIIRHLLTKDHQAIAGQILNYWLSQNFVLPQSLMLNYLEQVDGSEEISGDPAGLFVKLESAVQNSTESPENTTFLLHLARRKKEQNDLAGAIKTFRDALKSMTDVPEFSAEKHELFKELGNCHYQIDHYQQAREYYEKASFIEKDPFVLFQLGNIHFMHKEIQATEDYYLEALYLAREQNSTRLIARIEHQLGILHTDRGNFQEAKSHFQVSISLSQQNQELGSYADSLHEFANVLYLSGDYQNALDNYEKSFLISAEQGNVQDTAISLHQIGMTYHSMGESARAIEKLQESLKIAGEIGDDTGILDTNYQLGAIYLSLGNEKSALEKFQTCLALARKNVDERAESDALHEIGYVYAMQSNFQEAREKFKASLEISQRLNDHKRVEGTEHELEQLRKKMMHSKTDSIFSDQAEELIH